MNQPLPLTGERTVPGIDRENYWFRRHEAVYAWIAAHHRSGVVLEAGCGEGYGADLLRRAGCSVIAVDYDAAVVDHVARRYPAVTAVRANLVDLPSGDGTADLVVSLQVIEHLWDLPAFLAEAHRVLRPGGRIVVSTPNRLTFSPGLDRGDKPTNPFHMEEFDAAQVAGMLTAAAFADVEVRGLFHGPRLEAVERAHGPWVQRQIDAVLADSWSPGLVADVAAVTVADFDLRPIALEDDGARTCLDLIGAARKAVR